MKKDLIRYIDEHKEEIYALGDALFTHPELGFKEVKTGEIIRAYMNEHDLKVDQTYALTGFSITLGSGYPHIGVIAELDAIPTKGHPFADKDTTAAHACGHSTQVTITLAALSALKEEMENLEGRVTLFFTPAEEFTDLAYRRELVKEGKVPFMSGKEVMLYEHVLDDVDCIIHLHAMGDKNYHFSIDSVLSGFVHKRIIFEGKSAHAAMGPSEGINALHECTLFINALNMLRETFREEDVVRVHGIINDGGNTVNSIPGRVEYECYVRSVNPDVLQSLSQKITAAAKHCAAALGGNAIVEDTPGYLPLHQSKELNEVIHENILHFAKEEEIKWHEYSAAAGDVGDICMFKPIVQYGYNGISGSIHGADMAIADKEEVYITQAKVVAMSIYDLLKDHSKVEKIKNGFKAKMTYEEYVAYLRGEKEQNE